MATFSPHCQICLDRLEGDIEACPCGHVFHGQCIKLWWNKKIQCPTCKATFRRKSGGQLPLVHLFLSFDEGSDSLTLNDSESTVEAVRCGPEGKTTCNGERQQSMADIHKKDVELIQLRAKESSMKKQIEILAREKVDILSQKDNLESTLSAQKTFLDKAQLDAIEWTREANRTKRMLKETQKELAQLKKERFGYVYFSLFKNEVGGSNLNAEERSDALGQLCRQIMCEGNDSWQAVLKSQHKLLEERNFKYSKLLEEKSKIIDSERSLKQKVADLQDFGRKAKSRIEALKAEVANLKKRYVPKCKSFSSHSCTRERGESVMNKENQEDLDLDIIGSGPNNPLCFGISKRKKRPLPQPKITPLSDTQRSHHQVNLEKHEHHAKKHKMEPSIFKKSTNHKTSTSFSFLRNKSLPSSLNDGKYIKKGYNKFGAIQSFLCKNASFAT